MSMVFTGIGVWTSSGKGRREFWDNVIQGEVTLSEISRFDCDEYPFAVAGQLTDYESFDIPGKLLSQTDVWTRQALVQTTMAITDSGLDLFGVPEYSIGVAMASSAGGVEFGQREIQRLWDAGPEHVSAYQSIAWFYAATTGQMSIMNKFRGQCDSVVLEAAGGLDAIAVASESINCGSQEVMLCGGSDSALSPYSMVCQWSSGYLSGEHNPEHAYAPFSKSACGWVMGEGGAVLVAESEGHAANRNARIYGRVLGYACTIDSYGQTSGESGAARAISQAMRIADVNPREIDLVFADGAGLPGWDQSEVGALVSIFGAHNVPVTVPKAGYGRLYSGGGAVDVATALIAMTEGLIPPMPNHGLPNEELELDLVTEARVKDLKRVLVLARGHGGFNCALVLSR